MKVTFGHIKRYYNSKWEDAVLIIFDDGTITSVSCSTGDQIIDVYTWEDLSDYGCFRINPPKLR